MTLGYKATVCIEKSKKKPENVRFKRSNIAASLHPPLVPWQHFPPPLQHQHRTASSPPTTRTASPLTAAQTQHNARPHPPPTLPPARSPRPPPHHPTHPKTSHAHANLRLLFHTAIIITAGHPQPQYQRASHALHGTQHRQQQRRRKCRRDADTNARNESAQFGQEAV